MAVSLLSTRRTHAARSCLLVAWLLVPALVIDAVACVGADPVTPNPGTTIIVEPEAGTPPTTPADAAVDSTSSSDASTEPPHCVGNRVLYVDAAALSTSGTGTIDKPFKTLTAAIGSAVSGTTICMQPGTYDASLGESWPLNVPDGVTIGRLDNATGTVAIMLDITKDGLIFKGAATLIDLQISGGINATTFETGTSTAKRVHFIDATTASLVSDTSIVTFDTVDVKSTDDAVCREGIVTEGTSKATIVDSTFFALFHSVVSGGNLGSTVSISGGSIELASFCHKPLPDTGNYGVIGVVATAPALAPDYATIIDGTLIRTNGTGVQIKGPTKITKVIVKTATIGMTNQSEGIFATSGDFLLSGSTIEDVINGAQVMMPAGETARIDTTTFGGTVQNAIQYSGGSLTVRMCQFTSTYAGGGGRAVYVQNATVNAVTHNVELDLGTTADPGGNQFTATGRAPGLAVDFQGPSTGAVTLRAAGNSWWPNIQGADASGTYASGTNSSGLTDGMGAGKYNLHGISANHVVAF